MFYTQRLIKQASKLMNQLKQSPQLKLDVLFFKRWLTLILLYRFHETLAQVDISGRIIEQTGIHGVSKVSEWCYICETTAD